MERFACFWPWRASACVAIPRILASTEMAEPAAWNATAAIRTNIRPARRPSEIRQRKRSAGGNHVFPHRELEQFGVTFEAELFHYFVFVKGHSSWSDAEDGSHLFHGPTLGQQLDHLALSLRQVLPLALPGISHP